MNDGAVLHAARGDGARPVSRELHATRIPATGI